MTFWSSVLIAFASLLLFHSGFSSHEFHQLLKSLPQDSPSQLDSHLPKDIQYETLAAVSIFTFAVFSSFKKLRYYPLQGPQNMITLNQFLPDIQMNKATNVDNLIGNDPYGEINYTANFVDVHAKREQTRKLLQQTAKKES
ncbi:related to ER membrane protein complex subunit 5 [Zygosaccharomyces bailii ISA1307]|uniref:BN860_02278g1_1 n=1 Tax=Zygosaccharomyces bailii (strain CLIB 213 / ATCC 58445 / CBS 680 / BCRC 21525 / NBRC 1098 / NCYC 1416 / NRRL Y-2227) TaxID=1333698 RepID=A0A8J2T4G1_ZYGB2|nr:BN860_02278g1_1 [Zygosaccharomyces bailii CLIB 213]CDH09071.1 related to ER membrane protein complex subunit 5 [Zygosaccharomyces bailii ISA1307]